MITDNRGQAGPSVRLTLTAPLLFDSNTELVRPVMTEQGKRNTQQEYNLNNDNAKCKGWKATPEEEG